MKVMKIVFKNKKVRIIVAIVSCFLLLTLTGCRRNKATVRSQQNQTQGQSNQPKNIDLKLSYGGVCQAENLITVPIIVNNVGKNSTVISSRNFSLIIDGHKLKPFQSSGEPSDFHNDLAANASWQNTLSFYAGTKVPNKFLNSAYVEYEADNGKTVKGNLITNAQAQQEIQKMTFNATSLGDYYAKSADYITASKESIKTGNAPTSLKNQFQDSKYDQLRLWVLNSTKYPDIVLIKVINSTNTDMVLPFGDFQLEDKDKNDIQAHPDYRPYTALIPHGKAITLGIPMETELRKREQPYQVMLRPSHSGAFINTRKTFNEAEFALNDSKDLSTAFKTTPDKYPESGVKWKKVEFGKKELTVNVTLYDYFYIQANKEKYALVGLNNNGTVGDSTTPLSVTPTTISGKGSVVKLTFDDLSVIKSYKKIALKYNDKILIRIK